jgi:hypothetical protein
MLEKIDAREVYGDEGDAICHPPVCECEGCKLPLPNDGYLDSEQAAYYSGSPIECRGYLLMCECGTCTARERRILNGGMW